jgi:hypothetical protein
MKFAAAGSDDYRCIAVLIERVGENPLVVGVDIQDGQAAARSGAKSERIRVGKFPRKLGAARQAHTLPASDGGLFLAAADVHRKSRNAVRAIAGLPPCERSDGCYAAAGSSFLARVRLTSNCNLVPTSSNVLAPGSATWYS